MIDLEPLRNSSIFRSVEESSDTSFTAITKDKGVVITTRIEDNAFRVHFLYQFDSLSFGARQYNLGALIPSLTYITQDGFEYQWSSILENFGKYLSIFKLESDLNEDLIFPVLEEKETKVFLRLSQENPYSIYYTVEMPDGDASTVDLRVSKSGKGYELDKVYPTFLSETLKSYPDPVGLYGMFRTFYASLNELQLEEADKIISYGVNEAYSNYNKKWVW